jgi:hypothetical protein
MSEEQPGAEESEFPEGKVRKVRRVKKGRRSKQTKSSSGSNSLLNKGKELLHGIQADDDDSGHVNVAEQVRRLTKKKDDSIQTLDEVWGTKKRSTSWLWVSLLAVILPLIGVGVGISMLSRDQADEETEGPQIELPGDLDAEIVNSHTWFDDDSTVWLAKAVDILRAFNTAKSPDEVMAFVRPSPYRVFNPIELNRWSSPMKLDTMYDVTWRLPTVSPPGGGQERGYVVVSGQREDFQPFSAYFVEEGGELLLDWDATTHWCEVPFAEFVEEKSPSVALIRGIIEKKPTYDSVIGGISYSGYLLTSHDGSEFIFCYLPLDSDKQRLDDDRIKTILNYKRFVGPLLSDLPITLRVRFGDGKGGGKRFEIVDLVHDKWVRP